MLSFLINPAALICSFVVSLFRLYLINSPVVRAENLRFKEDGVRDVLKDVFLPWYNAYRFLVQNVQRLQKVHVSTNGSKVISPSTSTMFLSPSSVIIVKCWNCSFNNWYQLTHYRWHENMSLASSQCLFDTHTAQILLLLLMKERKELISAQNSQSYRL